MKNTFFLIVKAMLVTFFTPILLKYLYSYFTDGVKSAKETRTMKNWIVIFEEIIKQNNKFSIGPVSLELFFWLKIDDKTQKGWYFEQVDCKYSNKTNINSNELQEYIENNWEEEMKKNCLLTNESRLSLSGFISDYNKPILEFCSTNYKKFIGTNKKFKNDDFQKYLSTEDRNLVYLPNGYEYLNKSNLSNDLATATTIITKDNKVILSKRSKDVYILPNFIHTSIAEGMHAEKDLYNNKPNPFLTIKRGAIEELKLNISEHDIEILGFGIYRDYAQPFVVAKVKVDKTYEEIKNDYFKGKIDNWEGRFFAVNFNIEDLSPFIFSHKFFGLDLNTAELAKASLILCILQKFGKKKTERLLRKNYKFLLENTKKLS